MKKGFTLAEALIAMAIISIIVVALAPTINNILPDKYKPIVLKYYSAIAEKTDEMLDNEFLYYSFSQTDGNGFYTPSCIGLECQKQPLITPYRDANFVGTIKYPNLLADMLNLTKIQNGQYSSQDGYIWTIDFDNSKKRYNISINFNPNNSSSCIYSANCNNPDIFIFNVNLSGKVSPGDAMTAAYIINPKGNKKDNRNLAKIKLKDFN